MTLVPLNPEYQFIQNTEPSSPKKSDWWLDTSVNPPKSKVYDGASFVEPQSVSFVDQQVSTAGASVSDIESGSEDALEEDISNMSPASNSVAGRLNGGVPAGVDWSTKTTKLTTTTGQEGTLINVSGSGYITHIFLNAETTSNTVTYEIIIDGTTIINSGTAVDQGAKRLDDSHSSGLAGLAEFSGVFRFDSSFKINAIGFRDTLSMGVAYALD